MGGGAVLQEDKAEPPHQTLLRAERERRQDAGLDCIDCPSAVPDSESRDKTGQQDLLQLMFRNFRSTFQAQES